LFDARAAAREQRSSAIRLSASPATRFRARG
jgi:hypothetical protein